MRGRDVPKRQRIARTDEIKRRPWQLTTSVVVANRRASILYRLSIISGTARRKWREHPRVASLTYRRRKWPTHPRRVNPLAFPNPPLFTFIPATTPFFRCIRRNKGQKRCHWLLLWNTYSVSPLSLSLSLGREISIFLVILSARRKGGEVRPLCSRRG